jgi:hypothetical protein
MAARWLGRIGAVGTAAAVFELSYKTGRVLDEAIGLSDWISDALARTTLNPVEYPKTTIYDYRRRGRPIPADVKLQIRRGLVRQGQSWPEYEEYPAWLKDDLRRRWAATLREAGETLQTVLPGARLERDPAPTTR